jgi:hypothetical protein
MAKDHRNFWDKFWKNEQGSITIWQAPNLPLIGWFCFMLASKLASHGTAKSGMQFLSSAFLFTWAYLEIKSGDSYFRRLLGTVVFLMLVVGHFKA